MLTKYKAVFFDAGGTLFRPYPSVGEIYSEVARRHGCHVEANLLEDLFRRAWLKRDGLSHLASHSSEKIERDWWRSLVHEVFSEAGPIMDFEKFFTELYDIFASPASWQLYPDAHEVLDALKKSAKLMGIVSNWDSRLFGLCEGLGVRNYFDFVLASAVFGCAKPNPKIFEEALKLARVSPEEAIHIGDSLEDDVRGAARAGIAAILIDRTAKRDHPKKHFPNLKMIRSLKELL